MKSAEVLPTAPRTEITGPARVERRLRPLLARLRPGDVAVVDLTDLDRAGAQALVDAQVAAVVDASSMISGRYANLGPQVLAGAGVVVLDEAGPGVLTEIRDGATVVVHVHPAGGDEPARGLVSVKGEQVAQGRVLDAAVVADLMGLARESLGVHLDSFTRNTTEFLRREQSLLLQRQGIPPLPDALAGRPVVVVVTGEGHAAELAEAKPFIKQAKPVLIGVDGGADALRKAGLRPDVVVVDAHGGSAEGPDLPTAATLRKAALVVARVDRGASAATRDAASRIGGQHVATIETSATSEDAALLIADAAGAPAVVGVGMHATLEEFLDRKRAGLPSTFLTRLALGPRLVDAAALPTLVVRRQRRWPLFLVLLIGLLAVAAAIATTPVGQEWVADLSPRLGEWAQSLGDAIAKLDPR